MPEDRVDIPTSFWERLLADRKRLAMVLIAVCALLFIGAALGVRLILGAERDSTGSGSSSLEPLDIDGRSAEESDQPSSSAETRTTDVPDPGTATDTPPSGDTGEGPTRAPRLAYRLGAEVWVADEDGGNAVKVADSEQGRFALAPDGTVLAWIDAGAHVLHLTTVATGVDIAVGPAEDVAPGWSPDSSYVAYTAQSPERLEVRRVGKDGSGDAPVGAGHSPTVSPNGLAVAYLTGTVPGVAGGIVVKELSGVASTLDGITASDVVFGGDGLIYTVSNSSVASERIMTSAIDGSRARELVGATTLARPVLYTGLSLSPDGKHLIYAATGDDGFSRSFISWLVDPTPIALTVRRDTYPMRWSADGEHVYFVEGNSFQGERTSLMRCSAEGLGRTVIVEGAGL